MGTTLVVSPHLDDAVLSLGGSIAAWRARGERVVVATVYTTGPALEQIAEEMRQFADYTTRRQEDVEAASVLGTETRWLDQIERAFRPPYLTGWSFFATPTERAGFTTLGRVTRALDLVADLAPDQILVPLGIGNHIDHVETVLAATDWAVARGWRDRLRFYEDFYALSRTLRRRHPVAGTRMWRPWQAPLLRARRLAIVLRAIAAAQKGPPVTELLAPELRGARWSVDPNPIDEARKLDAIERYGSQTRAFGGFPGIARALRAYHRWWGGAEPLWRAR